MHNRTIDFSMQSLNKNGEIICGDQVEVLRQNESNMTMVLADGLGSGVKAAILSTLTARMLGTMLVQGLDLEECVRTVASTLPICPVRQIAYATFTVIRIRDCVEAEIIQYDNPDVIMLRNGKSVDYPKEIRNIDGKSIALSHIPIQEGDAFITVSDGAVYASRGKALNLNWQRRDIEAFVERNYEPDQSALSMALALIRQCDALYGGEPGDDTTACVFRIRPRRRLHLLMGPPEKDQDIETMMQLLFEGDNKRVVCGGSTAALVSRYLGKPLDLGLTGRGGGIPPTTVLEGVDLVTEGLLTMRKVLSYATELAQGGNAAFRWLNREDGASQIARLLFEEATDIRFIIGRAKNAAHQSENSDIGYDHKMQTIQQLMICLENMGKSVESYYF